MWRHQKAADYVNTLKSIYGEPDVFSDVEGGIAIWYKPSINLTEVIVRDENITHDFPMDHKDFVYASIKLDVPARLIQKLAKVSGSIIIDGLKGTVTARCGAMIKNATTLGFVQDAVAGKIGADMKDEYAKRIRGNEVAEWYTDQLNEA